MMTDVVPEDFPNILRSLDLDVDLDLDFDRI